MAHIEINKPETGLAYQLLINGVDFSMEHYSGLRLVEVGDPKFPEVQEIGLQVTFVVTDLAINTVEKVELTDHFPEAAARVRSVTESESL